MLKIPTTLKACDKCEGQYDSGRAQPGAKHMACQASPRGRLYPIKSSMVFGIDLAKGRDHTVFQRRAPSLQPSDAVRA